MQLTDSRRMAINMAVVAQVHLAWQQYHNTIKRHSRANDINDIDQAISQLTQQAMFSQAASESDRIQSEARALRSAMSQLLAYAEAQDAYGAMLLSLNLDPVPGNYQQLSVTEISHQLDETYTRWDSGRLPVSQQVAGEAQEREVDNHG